MADKIKLLIADDVAATRDNIQKLVEFQPEIQIVGQAGDAWEAISLAQSQNPDVVLMDINMPGMDGLAATEIICSEAPEAAIIIMSVQGEQEYLRRAMLAGAKDYLIKPFTGDELAQSVKQAYLKSQKYKKKAALNNEKEIPGKVITIFSTKGGVGKSVISTNLAVALSLRTDAKVALLDANLQFGDGMLLLNVSPRATLAELGQNESQLDEGVLSKYMTRFSDKLDLLAAPLRPELADKVTPQMLVKAVSLLRSIYGYVIIDTAPVFNEAMLAILDASDEILIVSALDLPTVKNVKLCLEILESLKYDKNKIKLIINRADSEGFMRLEDVEDSLGCRVAATLPSDGKVVVGSVNKGIPFVIDNPATRVAAAVFHLAQLVAGGDLQEATTGAGLTGKLKRLLGRRGGR